MELTVKDDVTLISLQDFPAHVHGIADVLKMIADAGIDVDMISQTAPNGQHSSLSFTVDDNDFGGVLLIAAELRKENPDIRISVSSGNCKISVMDPAMNGVPGYAAKVFAAAASVHADLRMVTTSECDISILVVQADLEATVHAIRSVLE